MARRNIEKILEVLSPVIRFGLLFLFMVIALVSFITGTRQELNFLAVIVVAGITILQDKKFFFVMG